MNCRSVVYVVLAAISCLPLAAYGEAVDVPSSTSGFGQTADRWQVLIDQMVGGPSQQGPVVPYRPLEKVEPPKLGSPFANSAELSISDEEERIPLGRVFQNDSDMTGTVRFADFNLPIPIEQDNAESSTHVPSTDHQSDDQPSSQSSTSGSVVQSAHIQSVGRESITPNPPEPPTAIPGVEKSVLTTPANGSDSETNVRNAAAVLAGASSEPLPSPQPVPQEITFEPIPFGSDMVTLGGCESCGGGCCVPGRDQCCDPCTARTRLGRFFWLIYHEFCCPDPCYDPRWIPQADAAFFVEAARPVTQQRLRWDYGMGLIFPDRAEFFGANAGTPAASYNYHDMWHYTETANGNFSAFVAASYRSLYANDGTTHEANFGDMVVGTKSMVLDRELFQITFQFSTYIPVGVASRRLGTGHVSLEPSLILGVKLTPETYLQAQIAEWIPIGGDPTYEGAILHGGLALNQTLWRPFSNVPLIGTLESRAYGFQDGAYTLPSGVTAKSSGYVYVTAGAGLRLVVCDAIDFGVGYQAALTDEHFANHLMRTEFRWRY